MKSKFLSASLFSGLLIFPLFAYALNFETGEKLSSSETVNDDYYAFGGEIHITSDVNGDLIAAGGQLNVDSQISQDLAAAGGEIILNGEVKDDARLAGGNVTVNALIKDDLILAGGNVILGPTGFVGGDFITAGGSIQVHGAVNGNLTGRGGSIYINNVINGNVELASVDELSFGPEGKVMGNLTYKSPNPGKNADEKTVMGEIIYEPAESAVSNEDVKSILQGILLGFSLFKLLSILFIGLFFVWIFRFLGTKSVETLYKSSLKSFGIGFLVAFVTPLAALISLLTGIGFSLSFVLGLLWILALILGKLVAVLMLGMLIVRLKDSSGFLRVYGAYTLGALIYTAFGLIPFVGWVFNFLLVILGIGALTLYKIRLFEALRKEKKI